MIARILCRALACGALVGLVACRSDSRANQQAPAQDQTERAEPTTSTASTLRIDREMLRDLRITTSKVEEHRGGESSSLLGELGVNQNAYAEVSAPLSARVVSLRAVEGQRVAAGDVLAM